MVQHVIFLPERTQYHWELFRAKCIELGCTNRNGLLSPDMQDHHKNPNVTFQIWDDKEVTWGANNYQRIQMSLEEFLNMESL